MESFFDTPLYYGYTPYSQYREAPIQHPYYSPRNRQVPVQPQSARAPKLVSIPVQYAVPERRRFDLRSDAALKIQKAFRGYLVRKSVTKIAGINREVDEISERVSRKETADLVRTDAKERLKVVETLMSLLLKLDSVKGVDSGVRDLRRAVIKKAIALQEKSAETGVNEKESSCNSSESKSNEEALEKMVMENQRMVGLITELVHRNEKQTRLLGSLSQRVEMLERALINARLRKKRRHSLDCREDFF
ncbi:hypothetical protein ACLB2K_037027 [Fragaria x ananassa]